eukprot:TRINITY_DN14545_c0_g2_i3.p1 TRINITY_DN14545_c0_g2~~TRINITY_DN14545_c0_g2_i3.p1  ORF type:complete len:1795 (+),score=454.74 TRINITY_DN14545_c0_g2_i3:91-5475(+)
MASAEQGAAEAEGRTDAAPAPPRMDPVASVAAAAAAAAPRSPVRGPPKRDPQAAATAIQSTFRGFKVRRRPRPPANTRKGAAEAAPESPPSAVPEPAPGTSTLSVDQGRGRPRRSPRKPAAAMSPAQPALGSGGGRAGRKKAAQQRAAGAAPAPPAFPEACTPEALESFRAAYQAWQAGDPHQEQPVPELTLEHSQNGSPGGAVLHTPGREDPSRSPGESPRGHGRRQISIDMEDSRRERRSVGGSERRRGSARSSVASAKPLGVAVFGDPLDGAGQQLRGLNLDDAVSETAAFDVEGDDLVAAKAARQSLLFDDEEVDDVSPEDQVDLQLLQAIEKGRGYNRLEVLAGLEYVFTEHDGALMQVADFFEATRKSASAGKVALTVFMRDLSHLLWTLRSRLKGSERLHRLLHLLRADAESLRVRDEVVARESRMMALRLEELEQERRRLIREVGRNAVMHLRCALGLESFGDNSPPGFPSVTLCAFNVCNMQEIQRELEPVTAEHALTTFNTVVDESAEHFRAYEVERSPEDCTAVFAFRQARDALAFAIDLQVRLLNAPWPKALLACSGARKEGHLFCGLRLRTSLESGACMKQRNIALRRSAYVGPLADWVPGLLSVAQPGQIVVGQTAYDHLRDLRDLIPEGGSRWIGTVTGSVKGAGDTEVLVTRIAALRNRLEAHHPSREIYAAIPRGLEGRAELWALWSPSGRLPTAAQMQQQLDGATRVHAVGAVSPRAAAGPERKPSQTQDSAGVAASVPIMKVPEMPKMPVAPPAAVPSGAAAVAIQNILSEGVPKVNLQKEMHDQAGGIDRLHNDVQKLTAWLEGQGDEEAAAAAAPAQSVEYHKGVFGRTPSGQLAGEVLERQRAQLETMSAELEAANKEVARLSSSVRVLSGQLRPQADTHAAVQTDALDPAGLSQMPLSIAATAAGAAALGTPGQSTPAQERSPAGGRRPRKGSRLGFSPGSPGEQPPGTVPQELHKKIRTFSMLLQHWLCDNSFPFVEAWTPLPPEAKAEADAKRQGVTTHWDAAVQAAQERIDRLEERLATESWDRALTEQRSAAELELVATMDRRAAALKELDQENEKHCLRLFMRRIQLGLEHDEAERVAALRDPSQLLESAVALLGKLWVFVRCCVQREAVPRPEGIIFKGERPITGGGASRAGRASPGGQRTLGPGQAPGRRLSRLSSQEDDAEDGEGARGVFRQGRNVGGGRQPARGQQQRLRQAGQGRDQASPEAGDDGAAGPPASAPAAAEGQPDGGGAGRRQTARGSVAQPPQQQQEASAADSGSAQQAGNAPPQPPQAAGARQHVVVRSPVAVAQPGGMSGYALSAVDPSTAPSNTPFPVPRPVHKAPPVPVLTSAPMLPAAHEPQPDEPIAGMQPRGSMRLVQSLRHHGAVPQRQVQELVQQEQALLAPLASGAVFRSSFTPFASGPDRARRIELLSSYKESTLSRSSPQTFSAVRGLLLGHAQDASPRSERASPTGSSPRLPAGMGGPTRARQHPGALPPRPAPAAPGPAALAQRWAGPMPHVGAPGQPPDPWQDVPGVGELAPPPDAAEADPSEQQLPAAFAALGAEEQRIVDSLQRQGHSLEHPGAGRRLLAAHARVEEIDAPDSPLPPQPQPDIPRGAEGETPPLRERPQAASAPPTRRVCHQFPATHATGLPWPYNYASQQDKRRRVKAVGRLAKRVEAPLKSPAGAEAAAAAEPAASSPRPAGQSPFPVRRALWSAAARDRSIGRGGSPKVESPGRQCVQPPRQGEAIRKALARPLPVAARARPASAAQAPSLATARALSLATP